MNNGKPKVEREWNPEYGASPPPNEIAVVANPPDRFGKSHFRFSADGDVFHHDVGDPFAEFFRRAASESVCMKMGYNDGDVINATAMKVIARKIIAAAESPIDETGNMPAPVEFGELLDSNPTLQEPVLDGLIRRGETANIVSASKVGKSWLAYHLALSIISGRKFLDMFEAKAGKVLLVDNELHPSTLANRIWTVGNAMELFADDYRSQLKVIALRGRRMDLFGVSRMLELVEPGTFDAIILDAWYRALPAGISENSNADVMTLYNEIDSVAGRLQCAWFNVHHSSKGSQGDKAVTDVGSGAGAQSRAADSHLILRAHEEDGSVVFDGAVRSFPPVQPFGLRWQFPLWVPDLSLDPDKLKGKLTVTEQRQSERDHEGIIKLADALKDGEATVRTLRGRSGLSRQRCERLLDHLESNGSVKWTEQTIRGNVCRKYEAVNLDNIDAPQTPF